MSVKNYIKSLIPDIVLDPLRNYLDARKSRYEKKMIEAQPELHRRAVERIRAKQDPINVVFFAIFDSVWKYDELYKLMERDSRFNPIILVCPVVNYSRENMLINMEKCYNLFKKRGYKVIRSYNPQVNQYVDVRKELEPDVIFYTNPYEGLIDDKYYIKNFRDIPTVYVSYAFPNTKFCEINYNLLLHNLVWKRYVENPLEVIDATKTANNKGKNVVYSGYPGTDVFIKKSEQFEDVWKIKDRRFKRIIWAPHHTITDYVQVRYSTFLEYCDFMLKMAHKYRNSIQIAFKPHPLLKNRLELLWGEEKTKAYYDKWANLSNGLLNDGEYEDLFMTSDAMIHDCGSFIGEYLFTRNPALYLSNGKSFSEQYNNLANHCLNNYYIGRNKEDIEKFILNLIEGKDPIKQKREEFLKKELLPPNGKLASENIMDDLIKELRS